MNNDGEILAGRTVLVTGASSGLGAHLAQLMARSGARVALAARRVEMLATVQAKITDAGGAAISVSLDVTDEASVQACYDRIDAAFGGVDSVIANAGMSIEGRALDIAIEQFDALMAVNVRGVFLTAREAARRMIRDGSPERGHGRILIVSSMTAVSVAPGLAPYSASKAAVMQLGRVLARDWARLGICVNSILPGYIQTELNTDWFASEPGQRQISRWPRKRLMAPSSLDSIALLLCSDASAQTTGSHFLIDDGQSMIG